MNSRAARPSPGVSREGRVSYQRRLGADDGTVLMGCSICGNAFRYPIEIRYCSDRLFRCKQFCTEKTNPTEEDRKNGLSGKNRDQIAPPFKVGPKPTGH